ncbi:sodium- and chloride-dependent glycine transporter 1-like [Glandiceps talaboti]
MAQPQVDTDKCSVNTDVELRDISGKDNPCRDENPVRGNWSRKTEFILSCLGYAVGLGNIWRFPYMCYANGGGAFLIPYVIMTIFVGMPLFFLELSIGQFASQGCIGVWKLSPLFKGIGYCMVVVSSIIGIYYNVIVSWSIMYLFASFSALPSLPWVGCHNDWNTARCYDDRTNATMFADSTLPTEEYFNFYVLKISSGIEETGALRWHLTLCLLLAWIVTALVLMKGVKSIGKAAYVIVPLPYLILLALFIRGITLPGSSKGIEYYLKPDLSQLLKASVWEAAASQVFFSLSAAMGGLHAMASYNKFHNNIYVDSLTIPIVNFLTSFFAGFAIFAILGFMAHDSGRSVETVVKGGAGLAYMAYPEALAKLPVSPLWSVLFFLMLCAVGLSSQVVIIETVITAVKDEFDTVGKLARRYKYLLPCSICGVLFLLGLPMVTEGGVYWVTLVDTYVIIMSAVPIAMIEIIVISCIYGIRRLLRDVKAMVGVWTPIYWYCLYITTIGPMIFAPFLLLGVLIYTFIDYQPLPGYPYWADPVIAWMITTACICPLFLYMVYHLLVKESGPSFVERLINSIRPNGKWGPMLERHRREAGYPPKDASGQEREINGGDWDRSMSNPSTYVVFENNKPGAPIVQHEY